jgi:hypothetical protein
LCVIPTEVGIPFPTSSPPWGERIEVRGKCVENQYHPSPFDFAQGRPNLSPEGRGILVSITFFGLERASSAGMTSLIVFFCGAAAR